MIGEKPPSQAPAGEVEVRPLQAGERVALREALGATDLLTTHAERAGDLLSRFLLVEVVNATLRSLSLDELLGRLGAVGGGDARRRARHGLSP